MSVSVSLSEDLEHFLQEQAHRLNLPLETLLSRTIEERWSAASRAVNLTSRETQLLLKIQNAFPPEQAEEYHMLCQRSDQGLLTDTQRQRFLELLEQRDLQNAERLEALAELSRLRSVPLRALMADLKIQPD